MYLQDEELQKWISQKTGLAFDSISEIDLLQIIHKKHWNCYVSTIGYASEARVDVAHLYSLLMDPRQYYYRILTCTGVQICHYNKLFPCLVHGAIGALV